MAVERYRYRNDFDGNAVRVRKVNPERRKEEIRRERIRIQNDREADAKRVREANRVRYLTTENLITSCLVVVLAFVVFFGLFNPNLKSTEVIESIEGAEALNSQLLSIRVQLSMDDSLEQTTSEIEDYAKQELGMRKVDSEELYYLGNNRADGGIIEEQVVELSVFEKIKNYFGSIF